MAFDEENIPTKARIEQVGDGADLQEVYDTERHLYICRLYQSTWSSTRDQHQTCLRVSRRFEDLSLYAYRVRN
jgi:hypothetical protein